MTGRAVACGGTFLLAGTLFLALAGRSAAADQQAGTHHGGHHGGGHHGGGAAYLGGGHGGGGGARAARGASTGFDGGFGYGSAFADGLVLNGARAGLRRGMLGGTVYFDPALGLVIPAAYGSAFGGAGIPDPDEADDFATAEVYGAQRPTAPDEAAPTKARASAHLVVHVPADAEVWIEGVKMTATGSVRSYRSPPLAPGRKYAYEIRARWDDEGRTVTQTQDLTVSRGSRIDVEFPIRSARR